MTNGFYNTSKFTPDVIKKFINDAIYLSYKVKVEEKYTTMRRIEDINNTVQGVIDGYFNHPDKFKYPLGVVDRFAYNQGAIPKEQCEYEIVLTYKERFLYIFVNEDSFMTLIHKYKLTLTEW